MREVMLQTAEGDDVTRVTIPPFPDRNLPDVIRWGYRTFRFSQAHGLRFPGEDWLPTYRECFAYELPITPVRTGPSEDREVCDAAR